MNRGIVIPAAFAAALTAAAGVRAEPEVLFYDDFSGGMGNWMGWEDLDWTPLESGCTGPVNCFGPHMLFNDSSHWLSGGTAARQETAQPWWYGSKRHVPALLERTGETIRVSVWQFEDFNRQAPDPELTNHDQIQGWLALMNEEETEFFGIGVSVHAATATTGADPRWTHVSWRTTTDGWNVTTFPRAQGWRKLEIVVHPYTGSIGDVEFFIDDMKVGEGHRQLDQGCQGEPVSVMALGANPKHVPESYLANTYEFFWYDEVTLSVEDPPTRCPNPEIRFDVNDDGFVDLLDFAVFQRCFATDVPYACDSICRCMDADQDGFVDGDDLAPFAACFSGPAIPADESCDDPPPP